MMASIVFMLLGLEIILIILTIVDDGEFEFLWPILAFVVSLFIAAGFGSMTQTVVMTNPSTGEVIEHTVVTSEVSLVYLFGGLALVNFIIFMYRIVDALREETEAMEKK